MSAIPAGGRCSFGGVAFYMEQTDALRRRPHVAREEAYDLTHVPYGDVNVLHLGGRKAATEQLAAIVPLTSWGAVKNLLGKAGVLVLVGGERVNATLVGIGRGGEGQEGYVAATLTFVVL